MLKMKRLTVEALQARVQMVRTLMEQELSSYDLEAGIVQIQSLIGAKGYRKVNVTQDGYLCYCLRDKANKKASTVYVHHIVMILADAETYIEQMSQGMTVNHINGINTDNSLSNLEYLSQSANSGHAHDIGLYDERKLEKKLSEQEVYQMLKAYHIADVSKEDLAGAYSLSVDSVNRIVKGKRHTPMYAMFKVMNRESIIHRKKGTPKVTDTDVMDILDLFFNQEWSQPEIADKHNISRSAVAMIVRGYRWTEVYQQFNKKNVQRMA